MPGSLPVRLVAIGLAIVAALPVAAVAQQPTRASDVITRQEIERVPVEDAYQVVLRLRPEFLHRAGAGGSRRSGDAGERSSHATDGGVLGGGTVSRAFSDPSAPEFDKGYSGSATGAASDGPVGFASPTATTRAPRAVQSATGPRSAVVVYVGNHLAGGIEELTTLPASVVKEIRYLRPSEAQFRFGPQGGAAVILVTLE
jgi:hypothetical protein